LSLNIPETFPCVPLTKLAVLQACIAETKEQAFLALTF